MSAAITIAFANHKGGVGKTAAVAAIGSILASKGYKVLMLDLDTQANLTRHFMNEIPERTIYDAIIERKDLPEYEIRKNLFLTPSCLDMAGVELNMSTMRRRENILSDLVDHVWYTYDYVLFDCPPSLGLVTMNALAVVQFVVVPMIADLMSTYGLSMMDSFCSEMQDLNPGVSVNYIFFNRYEKKLNMTEAIEKDVREKYGDKVLKTVVRKNVKISEAAMEFTDIVSYDSGCSGARDFRALTDELVKRIKLARKADPLFA